jgi:ketosteroid isomerase-like protein
MVTKQVQSWCCVALTFAGVGALGCAAVDANRPVPRDPAAADSAGQDAPASAKSEPAGERAAAGDAAASSTPSLAALRREAHRVIDDWHAAAAAGDAPRYLGYLSDDAVFMGTDSTERWDLTAFRAYVEQHMTDGKGWTYVPSDRGLVVPEGSSIAWFDERLNNESYGELRGTGVLRRDGDTWRIVHYSMTYTVPNGVARDVTDVIRGG